MTTSDNKHLAEAVLRWASKELDIPTAKKNDGKPVFHHFINMCKGNELTKLWKFGLENIKSESFVENARAAIAGKEIMDKHEDLKNKNLEKMQKLNQTQIMIRQLKEKLRSRKGQIYEIQLQNSELGREIDLNETKCFSLEENETVIADNMENVNDQKGYFDAIGTEIDDKTNKMNQEEEGFQIMTCQTEMEAILKEITTHVENGLKGKPKQNATLKLTWQKLNIVLNKFPALIIKDACINITKQQTKCLSESLETSLSKEDEILEILKSFSMDIEDIKDDITEKPLATMSRILQLNHEKAVKEYNTIQQYEKQTVENNNRIISFQNSNKNQNDDIKLVGLRAYEKSLKLSSQQLRKDVASKVPLQEKVEGMMTEIKDFAQTVESNKHKIESLTKQAILYNQTLPKDQNSASSKSNAMISDLITDNINMFGEYETSLFKEMELFLQSKENDLFKIEIGGELIPIWDLSINRPLYQSYQHGNDAYQTVSRIMELPISCPSYLFQQVCEARLQSRCSSLPDNLTGRISSLTNQLSNTSDEVSAFFDKFEGMMKALQEKGDSLLRNTKDKGVPLFNETLDHYINEPALKLLEK